VAQVSVADDRRNWRFLTLPLVPISAIFAPVAVITVILNVAITVSIRLVVSRNGIEIS
jgi:hypothetical protein